MFKILRVDMGSKKVKFSRLPKEYDGLGGRGLTSAVVAKEVPPTCTPIGPDNKLVFAPGLLGGTNAANSGRLSVGAKSPLTGGIKESNTGGQAGQYLARLGIEAIIVEGAAEPGKFFKLVVGKDKASLVSAGDLAGLGNYATVRKLKAKHGRKMAYVTIGQAGEMKLAGASIAFTDMELRPTRHAGRGGLGAVMGSKGLKAIVVNPAGGESAPIAKPDDFKAAAKRFAKALAEHPVTSGGLPAYGTAVLINIMNEAGGLPTRNFQTGNFKDAEKVSGERLNELTAKRKGTISHGCMTGCVIKCSGVYKNAKGAYVSKWPEYETIWAWGPNCGINDLDAIAEYDHMCDDFGLDTIEIGNAVAVAMEGGVIKFGDKAGAKKLLAQAGKGTPLGRVIGSGAGAVGQVFGVRRVPVVKNQAMPAYDPRAVKGIGVTYATSPMGADHTAGYSVSANILGSGGSVDPLKTKGQKELSQGLQVATALIDTVGLCLFVAFPVLDIPAAGKAINAMIAAKYGKRFGAREFGALGVKVLKMELDFNRRAGFGPADDRLPDWFYTEKLPPHKVVFDVSDKDLDDTLNI